VRRWGRAGRWGPLLLLLGLCQGCGADPETVLVGRWTEVDWSYEKLDRPRPGPAGWLERIAFPLHRETRIVRHEAEWWEFLEGGLLQIHKRDGSRVEALWDLKGRGHVLRLQSDATDGYEVYDVRELSGRALTLHYDVGMEVRGIARIRFERISREPPLVASRRTRGSDAATR